MCQNLFVSWSADIHRSISDGLWAGEAEGDHCKEPRCEDPSCNRNNLIDDWNVPKCSSSRGVSRRLRGPAVRHPARIMVVYHIC